MQGCSKGVNKGAAPRAELQGCEGAAPIYIRRVTRTLTATPESTDSTIQARTLTDAPLPPFELRSYQQDALRATLEGFQQYRRQLVTLPTGAGKTILFAKAAESFLPSRTLVLAHREELLAQAREKTLVATGIRADIEAAERKASLDAPVVVASVQTLARQSRRERFPRDHFGLIVVDEAHHALADSYKRILDHFEGAKVLGVSATPDRGDKKLLSDYFDNVAYELTLVRSDPGALARAHPC